MATSRGDPRRSKTSVVALLAGLILVGGVLTGQASAVDPACSTSPNPYAACPGQGSNETGGSGNLAHPNQPGPGEVGKADNQNPGANSGGHGQQPDGTDHNRGYECDQNPGVGDGNPAHTVNCGPAPTTAVPRVPTTSTTAAPRVPTTSTTVAPQVTPPREVIGENVTRPVVVEAPTPAPPAAIAVPPRPVAPAQPAAPAAPVARELAFTGSSTWALASLALALLLIGFGLVQLAGRRQPGAA